MLNIGPMMPSRFLPISILLGSLTAMGQPVFINEIFHHPTNANWYEQWIELTNTSDETVDLSQWRIQGDVSFDIPMGTLLGPGTHLIIASDLDTFSQRYPGITNRVGGWTGTLRNDIALVDGSSREIDSVEFHGEGDWAERILGAEHYRHRGWEWLAAHDGLGHSLELINPLLSHRQPKNWGSSLDPGGTPGSRNSIASEDVAPFIYQTSHHPAIPDPEEWVTIQARVLDERTDDLIVELHWRLDGESDFRVVLMRDDGTQGDLLTGDLYFAAQVPPQPEGTVVEFYLAATDFSGQTRKYPGFIQPDDSPRTANFLYQVDHEYYSGTQPIYRIIMLENERAELAEIGSRYPDADSDASMNATWIATDSGSGEGRNVRVRYNCGVRNRGHGSRTADPNNYHLDIPQDRKWNNRRGINLNSNHAHAQVLGSAVFRMLGLPVPESRAVQVRVNGENLMATRGGSYGSYAANDQYNSDFIERNWPLDSRGNVYRGIRNPARDIDGRADLEWQGDDPFDPNYANAYFKQNNALEKDWSDLVSLIGVLNLVPGYSSDETYVDDVRRVVDVEEWMKYMAINTLLDNDETCLANGIGDDYALFRSSIDGRFRVLPYDLDTIMGRGIRSSPPGNSIWRMTGLRVLNRFMKTPEFARVYYRALQSLADTSFSPDRMDPLLDLVLGGYVPEYILDNMKAFNAGQRDWVLSQIPRSLTVAHELEGVNEYPRTVEEKIDLRGRGDARETVGVRVNGEPADWVAWRGEWSISGVNLFPGLNRILIEAVGDANRVVNRLELDVWRDDGSHVESGGEIRANTHWRSYEGPYHLTSDLTIIRGARLVIEPGTTVFIDPGIDIVVDNGGLLVAEGEVYAPIHFAQIPGTSSRWGGIEIKGDEDSPESRISYAHIERNGSTAIHSNGGSVFLDHLTFGARDRQYVSLDDSSFIVQHCHFPDAESGFELVHGTGGVKTGGRGIFIRNFFGATKGYNDAVDFTGGNRPQPIVQFIGNVFSGASDDHLDLDGTDAWVEGNIFLSAHKNGSPDTASGVSGGSDGGRTSEITIINNIFYDCDQAAMAKQGNFFTMIHNTVVRQTHEGGLDTDGAVVALADEGTGEASGIYLESNILFDIEKPTRLHTSARVTFSNNLMPFAWSGPGEGNSDQDPLLKRLPRVEETAFDSWEAAQVLWEWFSPEVGSPALGDGLEGWGLGASARGGVRVLGVPAGVIMEKDVVLTVGINRKGHGIPPDAWPHGSGYTHYQYKLDSNPWSEERSLDEPIALADLSVGLHRIEVRGKNDAGYFQDDPLYGSAAVGPCVHTWTVDPGFSPDPIPSLRINEVLAGNVQAFTHLNQTPDLIELHNFGLETISLSGMGLTDDFNLPYQFIFPAGSSIPPGGYLMLLADKGVGGDYLHTGFGLDVLGDGLWLFDSRDHGGRLLDALAFGIQVHDFSIGRLNRDTWALCMPTFGARNEAVRAGSVQNLRINEWLTDEEFFGTGDFIELFNPGTDPVALGGLYLSDAAGSLNRHRIQDLSYIAGGGYTVFQADGDSEKGANHLAFKLSPHVGVILLSEPNGELIDAVPYGPQKTDVSQGRSPNGGNGLSSLNQPTPGLGNPGGAKPVCYTETDTQTLISLSSKWRFNQTDNLDGVDWTTLGYDDSSWPSGPALLGVESSSLPAPGIQTLLTLGRSTYYFRTRFNVQADLSGYPFTIRTILDDGAAIYLNGDRLLSVGLVSETPAYSTFASRNVGNATLEVFNVSGEALVPGENVIAVETHQVNSGSGDVVWGMELLVERATTRCVSNPSAGLRINELLAKSVSTTVTGSASVDFLELFNPSDEAVDLSDMSLTDDLSEPRKWIFPDGAVIQGRSFLVVRFDNGHPASESNTGFGLSAEGGMAMLFNGQKNGGSLIDSVRYGIQVAGHSIGRVRDDGDLWTLTIPTPGSVNVDSALGRVDDLRINEWMADPIDGEDWFELYNGSESPVSLEGLVATDDPFRIDISPMAPLSYIGSGTSAYVELQADNNPEAGADHVKFRLAKSGDFIGLMKGDGTWLDTVIFGNQDPGVSEGRYPDGEGFIMRFPESASPGASNSTGSFGVDTDMDGMNDFWELSYFGTLERGGDGDLDGDGVSDLEEFLTGSPPNDPLHLMIQVDGPDLVIRYNALAGHDYGIEYRDSIEGGGWSRLEVLAQASTDGLISISIDPDQSGQRYYRVVDLTGR